VSVPITKTKSNQFAAQLHFSEMSEQERMEILERFAGLVLESALARLLLELSEPEQAKLDLYLDAHQGSDDLVEYLLNTYPIFKDFLEEEMEVLQEEAIAITS
jgi:hypothetical protein